MLYRAIVIDPEKKFIDVIVTDGSLSHMKAMIGAASLDSFRVADFEDESWDYGWVNDTGLADGKPIHAFLFSSRKDPVAGRCLLLGVDKETRDTTDAKFPLDVLRANITWLGLILPEVTWDENDGVIHAIVTYARVRSA